LRVDPEDHPIFLTEFPENTLDNQFKTIQIFLEQIGSPSFTMAPQELLSLYSSGRTTGIVVSMGHEETYTSVISGGMTVRTVPDYLGFGGSQLTNYLLQLLQEKGYEFKSSDLPIINEIKEKNSNFNHEKSTFQLPDGKTITLGDEMSMIPMCLFGKTDAIENSNCGIQDLVVNTIQKIEDIDVQRELYSNIVIAGGGSLFSDLGDYLNLKVSSLVDEVIDVVSPKNRMLSTWNGGSMMCSLDSFSEKWITKQEYEEFGEDIANKMSYVF
jgi:actin, other eukaryote